MHIAIVDLSNYINTSWSAQGLEQKHHLGGFPKAARSLESQIGSLEKSRLRSMSSGYNLVYVPVGTRRSTNLGLAFASGPENASENVM